MFIINFFVYEWIINVTVSFVY